MVKVRPITPPEIEIVTKLGAEDDHGIIAPTHVVNDGELILGCFSVGSIPLVLPWLDTRVGNVHRSAKAFRQVETALRIAGQKYMAVPCGKESPFYPFVERAGYVKVYDNTLFMKVL